MQRIYHVTVGNEVGKYRAVQKYPPLLVDDIFLKIDQRTIIFLWKGVKCFCGGVRKPFRTIPDGSGHPRPIFTFFSISKKALFLWYTFSQNHHSTDDLKFTKITIIKWDFKTTLYEFLRHLLFFKGNSHSELR